MGAERINIEEIFNAARQIDDAAERIAYLDRACGSDATLRARVEKLLAALDEVGSFLDSKTPELASAPADEAAPSNATVTSVPLSEKPGTVIGRYKLLQLIGEGGFGSVYMAEQQEPVHRKVALKIIKLGMDTKQVIARFEAERQALAMMDHPNIAKVFDAGATETGRPYFVMELVKGVPITDYCDENNLSTKDRLDLFTPVCHAIQHAHQKGIIHRDIKPSNVLVTLLDDKPVPKVIDFGIAKATDHRLTEKTLFTEFRQLVGTPAYMSPEQAELTGLDVDTRTDIYSLGVLLYELLTGTTPFEAKMLREAAFDEVQRIIREVEPPKPSTRLSTLGDELGDVARHRRSDPKTLSRIVRGDLDWIVMKALEKDRGRRYETASELAKDIVHHLAHEPVLAGPPRAVYRLRKFVKRNRFAVLAGALVTSALVLGVVVSTIGFVQASRQRERTEIARDEAEQARNAETDQRLLAEEARNEAEHERDRAIAAERLADARRAEAQKVTAFLGDMLASVDPAKAQGRQITVKDVLDEASVRIADEFPDHPLVEATLRLTIGATYRELGRYDAAEPHLRTALRLRTQELGTEAVEVGDALSELALLQWADADLDSAERSFREALAIYHKAPGGDAKAASTLFPLAYMLYQGGRYAEGEQVMREALATGPDLPGGPESALNVMRVFHTGKGDYETAELVLREILASERRRLGNRHPLVANLVLTLGTMLRQEGDYDAAEPLLREGLAIRRKVLGDEHFEVAAALLNLALLLHAKGDADGAEPLTREALAILRENFGDNHLLVTWGLIVLGEVLVVQGNPAEAEPLLRECLKIRRQALPEGNYYIASSESVLGECLTALKRYDEAEPLLTGSYPTIKAARGEADMITVDALQRIIDLYEAWGKPDKAAAYRAMLPAGEESIAGEGGSP